TQGTVPSFTLQAEEESLTLTLPKGWMDEHYLRASELRLEVERQQKMGWPTRVQEA
ncbi:TPA: guanosine-5'-triphosphate,3'-diphosphate pyrophosphatase, partial [Aeromonas veronii]